MTCVFRSEFGSGVHAVTLGQLRHEGLSVYYGRPETPRLFHYFFCPELSSKVSAGLVV